VALLAAVMSAPPAARADDISSVCKEVGQERFVLSSSEKPYRFSFEWNPDSGPTLFVNDTEVPTQSVAYEDGNGIVVVSAHGDKTPMRTKFSTEGDGLVVEISTFEGYGATKFTVVSGLPTQLF